MKIAIVGATGLVGQKIIKVLEERNIEFDELIPVASKRSVGNIVRYKENPFKVVSVDDAIEMAPDYAIFSAGGTFSKIYAPKFAEVGTVVIDNSSAWRRDTMVPLIVPEVNADSIKDTDKIIANPNCSTIQMVLALSPLHKEYGLKRVVVSTYQSVSGSGMKGVGQLTDERIGIEGEKVYPHPIDLNAIPHGGDFLDDGYTTEEDKLVFETRKIFNEENIGVSATVVRIAVFGGHSESVNVELHKDFDLDTVRKLLAETPGITVLDNPDKFEYPTPVQCEDKDDVFVGRIRRDHSNENTLNMWVVADNLRKGAATNAVQIMEYLMNKA